MNVYRVRMAYYDGDHEHGCYESPPFATREAAESFRAALLAATDEVYRWWSEEGWDIVGPEASGIEETEVQESWDGHLKPAEHYLRITWT